MYDEYAKDKHDYLGVVIIVFLGVFIENIFLYTVQHNTYDSTIRYYLRMLYLIETKHYNILRNDDDDSVCNILDNCFQFKCGNWQYTSVSSILDDHR